MPSAFLRTLGSKSYCHPDLSSGHWFHCLQNKVFIVKQHRKPDTNDYKHLGTCTGIKGKRKPHMNETIGARSLPLVSVVMGLA